jgi:hypothetical protein
VFAYVEPKHPHPRGVSNHEALTALLEERSRAFQIARDVAIAQRRTPPTVDEFELSGILGFQRAIAGGAYDQELLVSSGLAAQFSVLGVIVLSEGRAVLLNRGTGKRRAI